MQGAKKMKNKLIEILKRYELNSFLEQISKLDEKINLKMGFLGEFNSGKSTLINAILEKKILPSMDKPTSKSIIEIEAKDGLEKIEYYKIKKNELENISAVDFADIALSNSEDKAMLKVPSNEFFKDGYLMIDTPGISSLDKSDVDITYGYLPFLDCAIICNDISKGSLTQSIIDFLLKDEVKLIINNLIFVITHSHLKSPKSQETIKQNIISQLKTLNKENNLGVENIEKKVIMVSALEAMEKKGNFSLKELKESFTQIFINRKSILLKERVEKELNLKAKKVLELLEYKKQNLNLDLSSLREKENQLESTVTQLESQKEKILKQLDLLDKQIIDSLKNTFADYLIQIKNIKNNEETKDLIEEIKNEISSNINKIISNYFESIIIGNQNSNFVNLEISLNELLKKIDIGKDIGMVVLVELLTLGSAGLAGVLGFMARGLLKTITNQNIGSSQIKDVASFAKKATMPIEFIGDKLGAIAIEKQILPKLDKLSFKIADDIKVEVENRLKKDVFIPLEEKLKNNQNMLNQIYKEKSQKSEKFISDSKELSDDILDLQLLIK